MEKVEKIRVNRSAVEARAKTLGTRRSFKVEAQVAAYINIARCLDLTTLTGADTEERVRRLCAKALNPLNREILTRLGLENLELTAGAVCVYPNMVRVAFKALNGRIPVASVATGFPAGQTPIATRLKEIEMTVDNGATEIDIVINRPRVFAADWSGLCEELRYMRDACGDRARMKSILAVGDIENLDNVARAARVAIEASRDGDFIKTSTGFEKTNATLEAGLVMARQIRESGRRIGLKPAGGVKSAKDAMLWYSLMLEELGEDWCRPELFRIGASSATDGLLADLGRQLHHLATGRYSALHHQAMG